jgi:hypothetical protein
MDEQQLYILIGQINGSVGGIQANMELQGRNIGKLFDVVNSLSGQVNKLPCNQHTEQLESLSDWKKLCNGNTQAVNLEKLKGTISLKNMIIVVVITNVITLGITLITNLIIVGLQ